MNANQRVFYQEVEMRKVLEFYAKSFKPPEDSTLLQWDANYDSHTGKVWFKLIMELPAPTEKNIIALAR